jgi:hypothetical protein
MPTYLPWALHAVIAALSMYFTAWVPLVEACSPVWE